MKKKWIGVCFLFALFWAWQGCTEPLPGNENPEKKTEEILGDASITQERKTEVIAETSELTPELVPRPDYGFFKRRYQYRLIAGISMGAGLSGMIGTKYPEKFDIIGAMGGPVEHRYTMSFVKDVMMTGFCDLESIEKSNQNGTLNSKSSFCAPPSPAPRFPFELQSNFNDWYYSNAGSNWNRTNLITVFQDLFLAFGNPLYQNEKSSYWPHPDFPLDWRSQPKRCDNPVRIKGFKHHLYNPTGKYDVISFCDGNGARANGIYDPDKPNEHTKPVEGLLAVDVNGNGKRDYGEPVVFTPHEIYEDVGTDGCSNDREDGKGGCLPQGQSNPNASSDPNQDDFDAEKNPSGTEKNLRYDVGEPYKDFGLDGIPNTKDYGENDGKFTTTTHWQNMMDHNPGYLVAKMNTQQLDRLNIYLDAGIRDLFNFQVSALFLHGAIHAHYQKTQPQAVQLYNRFISLMPPQSKSFSAPLVQWHDKGQHVYVRYGNPNPTQEELNNGDGDHVHGLLGLLERIQTFFLFATHHLPKKDLTPTPIDFDKKESLAVHYVYDSKALAHENVYSVVLPPGFHANTDKRYPVLYLGHGYGMSAPRMANLMNSFVSDMSSGKIAKMIIVAIHGACSYYVKDDENVKGTTDLSNSKMKSFPFCSTGTFYVDGKGLNQNGSSMEKAFFEVLEIIESKYKERLMIPEDLDYPYSYPRKK